MNRWVEWVDPFGPESEPVYCRVSEETAVATAREAGRRQAPGFEYESDEEALSDFMVVHWAWFCDPPKGQT